MIFLYDAVSDVEVYCFVKVYLMDVLEFEEYQKIWTEVEQTMLDNPSSNIYITLNEDEVLIGVSDDLH